MMKVIFRIFVPLLPFTFKVRQGKRRQGLKHLPFLPLSQKLSEMLNRSRILSSPVGPWPNITKLFYSLLNDKQECLSLASFFRLFIIFERSLDHTTVEHLKGRHQAVLTNVRLS